MYEDLLDVEDCSFEDDQYSHAELLREERVRRRRMVRKFAALAEKDELRRNSRKPEEAYRRDVQDQKCITKSDFAGIDSHHMFREDLRTETITRRNWDKLIQVEQDDTRVSLLDKYMVLNHKT